MSEYSVKATFSGRYFMSIYLNPGFFGFRRYFISCSFHLKKTKNSGINLQQSKLSCPADDYLQATYNDPFNRKDL